MIAPAVPNVVSDDVSAAVVSRGCNGAETREVTKPRPTVRDLIKKYLSAFLKAHRQETPAHVIQTLQRLSRCRTAALGGHSWHCENCDHMRYSYNSCHNRFCASCGDRRRDAWFDNVNDWVLPIRYYHAVFTLDHRLSPLIHVNQQLLYGVLFKSARRALIEMARDPALGIEAKIALVMVLHTWGQLMLRHEHLHILVPAGGFLSDGTWITIESDDFFLDEGILAERYRDNFCKALRRRYRAEQLVMPGELSHLAGDEKAFLKWLDPISSNRWHIHTCQPEHVHRAGAALQYLSRYVVGAAISDVRIVSDEGGQVTFRIKDYRTGERTTVTIPGVEFVSRLSYHILPPRLRRARYAGWLGNNERDHNLATARTALRVIAAKETLEEAPEREQTDEEFDIEDLMEELAAARFRCPECGKVAIRWTGELRGAMGWQSFQGSIPPIGEIRRMFEQASAHLDRDADKVRPPPALAQST